MHILADHYFCTLIYPVTLEWGCTHCASESELFYQEARPSSSLKKSRAIQCRPSRAQEHDVSQALKVQDITRSLKYTSQVANYFSQEK